MNFERIAPPQLQEAWIRRLQWHYGLYNALYTGGKLRFPIILIGGSQEELGRWDGLRRSIVISERHILVHPWESVLDTLRHEMAHQYVEEVLIFPGAPPHGEAFAQACRILRVDPRATASHLQPPADAARSAERTAMLQRVRELLALAGSPNEHEAATAMRLANKYLLKYNLSLTEGPYNPSYAVRHLGKSSPRIQEYEYTLSNILQDHFFVQVIWVFSYDPLADRPGRILQIAGTPENLEMAEYVYRYIVNLAEPLWRAHRERSGGGTRLRYLAGLLRGFEEKLESQKVQLREERGLIWRGDPLLDEFYRYMNPRRERRGYSGVLRTSDFNAGLRDGKEITLRRAMRGGAEDRGRLLEGGRPRGSTDRN